MGNHREVEKRFAGGGWGLLTPPPPPSLGWKMGCNVQTVGMH